MDKRMFIKEQVEELLRNENVTTRCSGKAISYNQNFKIRAVKQYNEYGMSPREIFRQAGFNLEVTGKERADDCLLRWRCLRPNSTKDFPDKESFFRMQ